MRKQWFAFDPAIHWFFVPRESHPTTLSTLPLETARKCYAKIMLNINFFDAYAPTEKSLNIASIPLSAAKLINQMNRVPRFLSLLGIIPNQLRTLLKENDYDDREEILLDLSRTLFFAGFRIWDKRRKMTSRYWKDIAPQNRNITRAKKKKKRHRCIALY